MGQKTSVIPSPVMEQGRLLVWNAPPKKHGPSSPNCSKCISPLQNEFPSVDTNFSRHFMVKGQINFEQKEIPKYIVQVDQMSEYPHNRNVTLLSFKGLS